jgi:hypothetical protein
MVLAAETRLTGADRARLTEDIRARVRAATGLSGLRVYLLRPRSIQRTTSGKLQRLAMRDVVRTQHPRG